MNRLSLLEEAVYCDEGLEKPKKKELVVFEMDENEDAILDNPIPLSRALEKLGYKPEVSDDPFCGSLPIHTMLVAIDNSNSHNYPIGEPLLTTIEATTEVYAALRVNGTGGNAIKKKDCRLATKAEVSRFFKIPAVKKAFELPE